MVRWGVVGFGLHGVKRLVPAFALAEHSRLEAISRSTQARAEESARQFSVPLAFANPYELCASPQVDAVLVASIDARHLQDVLFAVEARKPVLCEKPMAMNAAQAEHMVRAARAAGVLLGVAHIFRFHESVNRIRELLQNGTIGRPLLARADFCYWGIGHARQWIRDAAIACGGPTADVGVHCIDTLRYILGEDVVSVSAQGYKPEGEALEESAVLGLEFAKGTLGSVSVSVRGQYRSPVEIVGEKGSIFADDGLTVERPIRIEVRTAQGTHSEEVSNHLSYARQLDSFALAAEGTHKFECPGEEGLANQRVLDAAYRSMKSGRRESCTITA